MRRMVFLGCLAACAVTTGAARDVRGHSDILAANVGGQVAIGAAEELEGPTPSFDLTTQVFEVVMRVGFAPPSPADYEADEPGIFALDSVDGATELAALGAAALPGGAAVGGTLTSFEVSGVVDSLFFWDGVGAVNFVPAAATQPGVAFSTNPAMLGVTGPRGALDAHSVYQFDATPGTPADGVYLGALRLNVDGLAPSRPFFMVALVDSLITNEDDHEAVEAALEALEAGAPDAAVELGGVTKDFAFFEAAVAWTESNLVVPEPCTPWLAATGGLAILARRRARRSA